jgi:hypothetical protein
MIGLGDRFEAWVRRHQRPAGRPPEVEPSRPPEAEPSRPRGRFAREAPAEAQRAVAPGAGAAEERQGRFARRALQKR